MSNNLEMSYRSCLRDTEKLISEETARRSQVTLLLLKHEIQDLQQLRANDQDHMEQTAQARYRLQSQLQIAQAAMRNLEGELRSRTRELQTAKVPFEVPPP